MYAFLTYLKQQLSIEKQICMNERKQSKFDKYLLSMICYNLKNRKRENNCLDKMLHVYFYPHFVIILLFKCGSGVLIVCLYVLSHVSYMYTEHPFNITSYITSLILL